MLSRCRAVLWPAICTPVATPLWVNWGGRKYRACRLQPGPHSPLGWTSSGELPNFKGDYPNGIQLSADGKSLFINLWAGSRVQKLDRFTGELLGEAEVKSPDNSEWDASGKLLIASHDLSLWDFVICLGAEQGACPASSVLCDGSGNHADRGRPHPAGRADGAGTVAQQVGDRLYIGSFIGDWMMSVPYVAKVGRIAQISYKARIFGLF